MDPVSAFGLISAAVQVLQAVGSTVQGLNHLYGKFRGADLTINSLIQELNCIDTALTSLKEWTLVNSANGPQSEEFNQDVAVAMDGCRVIMDVVSHDVSDLVQSTQMDGIASFRVRMRVVWSEETMRGHQEKLHAQVNALQLLLQVCQCRTTTEQLRLLRKATTRRIIDRVADDTATVLSTRASSYASSIPPSSRQSLSDRSSVDFNQPLAGTAVYHWLHQRVPTSGSSETSPTFPSSSPSRFTDEGYGSSRSRTESTNLTIPSLDIPPQQRGYLGLPSTPSAPVHSGHSRSVSHTQFSPPSNPTVMRRRVSDSNASSPTSRTTGSRLGRIKSSLLGRLSTRSSANLAVSPGSSPNLSSSPGSGRRRQRLDADFTTSIDLTSEDAALVPEIVKAAQTGSRDDVERLIIRSSALEVRDPKWGRTALLVAAHCGRDDIVDLMIQNNARVTVTDGPGWTALHLAASRGHCSVLELLVVESDLMEAQTPRGETALRIAADYGQPEAVQVLLTYHAQVNARAAKQMTALHAAAKRGDSEMVQLLASSGADLEAKDVNMMTALHYACEAGHLEVIKILLSHRANIESLGSDRKTPLMCAAEAGRAKAVEYLLQRKASFRSTDETGMAAVHWAAYNGHQETVRLLSEMKGSLEMVTDNDVGRTALHLAAMRCRFAVVELLQRKGAPLDKRCKKGFTALHYACMAECFGTARLLLLTGADIEAVETEHQERPLHIVAARGSLHILDLLCDKGAALDTRNGFGDRPICAASRNGHVAIVQKLLDRGSLLSAKFNTGFREDSPLCLAAMGGHSQVCSLLLSRGAEVLKKDERGWHSIRCAAHHGQCDVLQLLLSASNIPEADILNIMNMSEDLKFSRQISTEKRHEVEEVLRQALRPPNPTPTMPPTQMAMPQAWSPHHSMTRMSTPPIPLPFEADSSTPQELPGSLDQDSAHTQPPAPEPFRHVRHQSPVDAIPQTAMPERQRPIESPFPLASDQAPTLRDDARRAQVRSQPQPRHETRSPSRPRQDFTHVYATYSPVSIPPTLLPPVQPSRSLSYHTGNRMSMTLPSPPRTISPDMHADAAQIPRSLPVQASVVSTQDGERTRDDESDDSDSISSVYTAPEGESEPEVTMSLDRRIEIKEAA